MLNSSGHTLSFPFPSAITAARPQHLLSFPYPLLAYLGVSGGAVITECFYSNSCSCSRSLDKTISWGSAASLAPGTWRGVRTQPGVSTASRV